MKNKNTIFNPNVNGFNEILNSEYYVDKTELILHLNELINTSQKYVCITRPRRFGKTIAVNMITKYYQYLEKETTIFNDKKISKHDDWDKYLNKFNIIKLTMNDYFEDRSVEEGIKELKSKIVNEVKNSIKQIKFKKKNFFTDLFQEIYNNTERQIVFIIDEWDYILRNKKNEIDSHKKYLEFLNTLLKDKDYVALAYITGIFPIKKNENQSSLNNFDELSMILPGWMSEYIGFTNSEVEELCTKQKEIIQRKTNKKRKLDDFKNNTSKKRKINNDEINNKEMNGNYKRLIYNIDEKECKKNKKNKKDKKTQKDKNKIIEKDEKDKNNEKDEKDKKSKKNKKDKKTQKDKNKIIEKDEKDKNNKNNKKDKKDKKTQKDKNKIIEKDEKDKNNKNNINFKNLKIWYNGYKLKNDLLNEYYEIYSPYSIINALRFNKVMDYWCYSGTFYSLSKYIEMNFFGLKEDIILLRDGIKIKINISSYQNDMKTFIFKDDVFTMLVHLGYLAYDADTNQVYIPNKEIMNVFKTVTSGPMWNTIAKKIDQSRKLLKAIWEFNEKEVENLIEEYHNKTDNKTYNSEDALKFSILLAFYAAEEYYNEYLELDSGKGYIDIAYVPINVYSEHPALIIELKYEKNVDKAMNQIKKRKYYERIKRYKDNMLLIGINYNKEIHNENENYKYHSCKIERFKG